MEFFGILTIAFCLFFFLRGIYFLFKLIKKQGFFNSDSFILVPIFVSVVIAMIWGFSEILNF